MFHDSFNEPSKLEVKRNEEIKRMKRELIIELPDMIKDKIEGDYFWKAQVISEAVKILKSKWKV